MRKTSEKEKRESAAAGAAATGKMRPKRAPQRARDRERESGKISAIQLDFGFETQTGIRSALHFAESFLNCTEQGANETEVDYGSSLISPFDIFRDLFSLY